MTTFHFQTHVWDFLTEMDFDLEKITKLKNACDKCLPALKKFV